MAGRTGAAHPRTRCTATFEVPAGGWIRLCAARPWQRLRMIRQQENARWQVIQFPSMTGKSLRACPGHECISPSGRGRAAGTTGCPAARRLSIRHRRGTRFKTSVIGDLQTRPLASGAELEPGLTRRLIDAPPGQGSNRRPLLDVVRARHRPSPRRGRAAARRGPPHRSPHVLEPFYLRNAEQILGAGRLCRLFRGYAGPPRQAEIQFHRNGPGLAHLRCDAPNRRSGWCRALPHPAGSLPDRSGHGLGGACLHSVLDGQFDVDPAGLPLPRLCWSRYGIRAPRRGRNLLRNLELHRDPAPVRLAHRPGRTSPLLVRDDGSLQRSTALSLGRAAPHGFGSRRTWRIQACRTGRCFSMVVRPPRPVPALPPTWVPDLDYLTSALGRWAATGAMRRRSGRRLVAEGRHAPYSPADGTPEESPAGGAGTRDAGLDPGCSIQCRSRRFPPGATTTNTSRASSRNRDVVAELVRFAEPADASGTFLGQHSEPAGRWPRLQADLPARLKRGAGCGPAAPTGAGPPPSRMPSAGSPTQ